MTASNWGRRERHPQHSAAPLRLLVIGDSLAAGVGMSESSVPRLPVAIATQLSAASGRPVQWTCVGTPGTSASRIVRDIQNLDFVEDKSSPLLLSKLAEWQKDQRLKTQQKLIETQQKVREWWNIDRKKLLEETTNEERQNWPKWKRWAVGRREWIKRGIKDVTEVLQKDMTDSNHDESDHENSNSELDQKNLQLARRRTAVQRIRKFPTLNPSLVGKYDVAVVLTGLNDLKDTFLPFMYSKEYAADVAKAKKDAGDQGILGELLRVVHELRGKMKVYLPSSRSRTNKSVPQEPATVPDQQLAQDSSHGSDLSDNENRSLVVFPAIPIAATKLGRLVPLNWFLNPLFRFIDSKKQSIATSFPGLVLYVEAPSTEMFAEAESLGALWEEFQKEDFALNLTDIAHVAKERIEGLMKQHYRSWVRDAEEEDDSMYVLEGDSVVVCKHRDYDVYPGSTLISADGIHPNDEGYRVWGSIIGQQIVEEWRRHGTIE